MFVGDSGVGKSTIINTIINETDGSLNKQLDNTNFVDIFFKKLKIKEGTTLLNVTRI